MVVRRNIVVVLGHGLRSDAIGDSRAWPLQTPNLQKLAARSLRLVATSVCPSDRGGLISLLTGVHARQHGVTDTDLHATAPLGWPSALIDEGYHVAAVGCVGALGGAVPDALLVQEPHTLTPTGCAYLNSLRPELRDAVILQRRQRMRAGPFEPDRLLMEPDEDIDGFIAAQARKVIAGLPEDRPWALLVVFSGPGNDLPPPTLYDGLVSPHLLEEAFAPADFRCLDAMAELDYPRVMLQRLEPPKLAQIRADYLGRVSLIDYAVGRFMTELWRRQDRERTWMVVSADRGQLLGEHGLIGHRSFLCGAVEVPVIIAPPTPLKMEQPIGLASTIDVAATVLDLAGADAPDAVAGQSLLQVLRDNGGESLRGRTLISEFGRRVLLETERYKVIFDTQSLRVLGLYDMVNDAGETENLVETPAGLNLIDSLRWRLGDALLPLRAAAVR